MRRQSQTGSGWLEAGCEAGEYCGETGQDWLGYHLQGNVVGFLFRIFPRLAVGPMNADLFNWSRNCQRFIQNIMRLILVSVYHSISFGSLSSSCLLVRHCSQNNTQFAKTNGNILFVSNPLSFSWITYVFMCFHKSLQNFKFQRLTFDQC